MSKKLLLLFMCMTAVFTAGCQKNTDRLSVERPKEPSSSVESVVSTPVVYKNPLTGISGFSKEKADDRPVAVMINNLNIAQPVQTGLVKSDIVFETEVEGGITRLLAVFQDVSKVEKIGTIRSARYPYVDLAAGINAIYIHIGQDDKYCKPHLGEIDDVDIDESNYGVRISNGLSKEHTLYAYGEKLWNGLVRDGVRTEKGNSEAWVKFADEKANLMFGNTAGTVSIPFSNAYKSVFKYDSATGRYTRYFGNNIRKDYATGEAMTVKNLLVLTTSIRDYSDRYHRQVDLQSGSGYYCVNGTYTPIKWSKGATKNSFKFTAEDGSEVIFQPGNFWVCISDKSKSQPIFN